MLHRPQFGNARYCYKITMTAESDVTGGYSPENRAATASDVTWRRRASLMQAPNSGIRDRAGGGGPWKEIGVFSFDDDGDLVGFQPMAKAEWDDVLRVLDSLDYPRETATPYNFKPSPEICGFEWEVRPVGHEWFRNQCSRPKLHKGKHEVAGNEYSVTDGTHYAVTKADPEDIPF